MCGIVGVVARNGVHGVPLEAMRDTMAHRGPDDRGGWMSADGTVALAHRRLAVIDLSPGGHQPMHDATGTLSITFNGEIYNYVELRNELRAVGHTFRTGSDTEVILESYRRWGPGFVSRLNGQFAFSLHDASQGLVILARDRAGEKPLFYAHGGGQIRFASELKALMADPTFPRELDPEALDCYLAYGYVPNDRCILRGVRKLPQGHMLTYDLRRDTCEIQAYWRLPPPPLDDVTPAEALVGELDTLLEQAVRRQLVADVPIGILLSGGLDSSLITAMAARVTGKPVRTFTVRFPGHQTFDEGPYARIVAEYFGTEHTELVADAPLVDLLPVLARQYDEPIADSSIVPSFLVSRLIRQHATVALGGDGGDELFGGYPHYSWVQWRNSARRFVPAPLRRLAAEFAGARVPVGVRGRNYVIGITEDASPGLAHVNVYFDRWTRRRLLRGGVMAGFPSIAESERAAASTPSFPGTAVPSLLRRATEADFRTTMCDAYLVKVDRASMLNSLEIRAPWLDVHLVEFAFGRVPDRLRATPRGRKILPRMLAARMLPPSLDLKRKQGFSIPLAAWLTGSWGPFFEAVLREADPNLFDQRTIQTLLEGQRRGRMNAARLFCLTMLELWRREYRIALPSAC
jgi:asparagine synthase (glutamine-hydrolysing)